MANILIGASYEVSTRLNLAGFLEADGHQVTYVQEPSEMIAEINKANLPQILLENLPRELKPRDYDIIICDTRLFYQGTNITNLGERNRIRKKLFEERVIDYLNYSSAKKIIIADIEVAKDIEELVRQKGFTQINEEGLFPKKIVEEISSILKSKDN